MCLHCSWSLERDRVTSVFRRPDNLPDSIVICRTAYRYALRYWASMPHGEE